MRSEELLYELYRCRVEITRKGNNLHLRARKGCITREIESAIKELKADMLNLFQPVSPEEGWTMVAQWRFVSLPEGTLGARLDTPEWDFWPRATQDGREDEGRGQ